MVMFSHKVARTDVLLFLMQGAASERQPILPAIPSRRLQPRATLRHVPLQGNKPGGQHNQQGL
jgi:hypothetical protein